MPKPKVAIFEFTDCEGCEVEIISLREKVLALEKRLDIVNWRLAQGKNQPGPYNIAIIEGTPITQHEIDTLKNLRKQSGVLIALGACACLGGIPAIMDKKERAKWYKKIYGEKYKPRGIDAMPLSAYVKVDYLIHGCPVNGSEVVGVIEELLAGKTPKYREYSVCFDCKTANNECRMINEKTCLGPITQGGCEAVCVSGGASCYGCFGLRKGCNIKGLIKSLKNVAEVDSKNIQRHFSMFLKKTKEYKEEFEK